MTAEPLRQESHPSVPGLYRTLSVNAGWMLLGRRLEPKLAPVKELAESVDDMCRGLRTSRTRGLTSENAKRRLIEQGVNLLTPPRPKYIRKFVGYVFGGFNSLLLMAAVLEFISWRLMTGRDSIYHLGVAVVLFVIAAVSTLFYGAIDYTASRTLASIQGLVVNRAVVMRDAQPQQIDAETLVRGDLVCLAKGQRVPADLRLIEVSADARFDRSILTGESSPVSGCVDSTSLNPLQSKNMALMSTFLVRGTVRGIVIHTGNETVIGNILQLSIASATNPPLSPIQRNVAYFIATIAAIALFFFFVAIVVWAVWIHRDYPLFGATSIAITNSIGVLTAFVPEGLAIGFAMALTVTARQTAKRNVLVKDLNMVETLGRISILCSDKTGTLTLGKMAVDSILFLGARVAVGQGRAHSEVTIPAMPALVKVARVCNDAAFEPNTDHIPVPDRPVIGDPTDSAIFVYAETVGPLLPPKPNVQVLFSLAFSSRRKFMAKVVRSGDDRLMLLVKGAPDRLLVACSHVTQSDGRIVDLNVENMQAMVGMKNEVSRLGHRVIAHCEKQLDPRGLSANQNALETFVHNQVQYGLTLIGLLALQDPPRPDVPGTVTRMRQAGIRVFMITGDYELTACSIANSVGILSVPEDKVKRVADLDDMKREQPLLPDTAAPDFRLDRGCAPHAIIIDGSEVEKITDPDWEYICARFHEIVFARTSPEQKLLIVQNLRKCGDNIVAVTGDGTNDAPALRSADVGVSMGSGTDIAKEAATMILLDNAFASVLVGIESGRLVYENLKKIILYLMLAGSYTQFIAVASNAFFGMPTPLSAFQQVLFDVTNDLIMAVPLMYERAETCLMDRPPRNARFDLITDWRFFIQLYVIIGPLIWVSCMGMWFLYMSTQGLGWHDLIFAFSHWKDGWRGRTLQELTDAVTVGQCIFYVTMAVCQIGSLFAVRNRTVSTVRSNPFWGPHRNLIILGATATSIVTCIVIMYGYWIQVVFETAPIPVNYWLMPFGFAFGIVAVDEVRKYLVRNYPRSFVAKIAW